jgi:hypothetical protein
MSLKLTPSESRTLNRFADLSAQKRGIQATLTPIQKELRELQVEVKAIIKAKGNPLPITSIKQRANIELSTTRSHLAYIESFVEGYYVDDNTREILKASAIK